MHRIAAFLLSLVAAVASPAMAQQVTYEVYEEVVYEEAAPAPAQRFVHAQPAPIPAGVARFGPFRVIDGARAAMVDVSDERSPAQFAAMLRAYPGIATLELIDVPGTYDDKANLRLGRMIRAQGISTHVPSGGSVRSGGVELFLAGTRHTADQGAEFAVHAWEDEDGLQATDYAETAPENMAYIAYYREMGMSPVEARAFYAMTNSAPFENARWMNAAQMGQWVRVN